MRDDIDDIFGRVTTRGHISLHYKTDGSVVTRLDVNGVYPVGSNLGCKYEHQNGLVLTAADAAKLNITIET